MKRDCNSNCYQPCPIKYTPNSISLNDQFKKYTVQSPGNLVIGWEHLLKYNTIVVEIVGNDVLSSFNLYLGGLETQKDQFIKCYKETNCVKSIPSDYIYAEIIVKLVGNVDVDVFKYTNDTIPLLECSNQFYEIADVVPVPADLKYHFHVFYTL